MAEQITPGKVYAIASDITSVMGLGAAEHWDAISAGTQGIQQYDDKAFSNTPFYGSMLDEAQWQLINMAIDTDKELSTFERLCLFSAKQALSNTTVDLEETVLILSTTKGNIELLDEAPDSTIALQNSANAINSVLGIKAKPIVVSHACISGSVALLYAHRLITGGRYKKAIIVGCDRFTPFVLNGFQSFQAIADGPCRPFDADRTGINLGEAAATIILSSTGTDAIACLYGGATSNDANHISGPSRTGEELSDAINRAMQEAGVQSSDINMISAHGTATAYNDEMEAKAIHLSGLSEVPLHSMKSYTGHTLGAAGVLESAMILEAIKHQQLIPSAGYEKHGVPVPVNVTTQMQPADIQYVLKTASGFGGSNAAIVWGRI
ncbi:MAG: beta-ketoacyl synthase [Chitinophagales bacterium]|nr:beta-ketoacyl synthase [Chitinophagales bacterium]